MGADRMQTGYARGSAPDQAHGNRTRRIASGATLENGSISTGNVAQYDEKFVRICYRIA